MIALSGGVDSAVAGLLLKRRKDVQLIGAVFMTNWDRQINESHMIDDPKCESLDEDLKLAKEVAHHLEIPLYTYNFTSEYWFQVFKPFISDVESNLIGNPDLGCNSKIKFGILLKKVKEDLGEDLKLATGHYARIIKEEGKYLLGTCSNPLKDQTYFLSRLTQEQLKDIIFPLSGFKSKDEIRQIAKKEGFPNWGKRSSRGICFIGKRSFNSFISGYVSPIKGKVVDIETNKELGTHKGLCFYSLHQRKGTNVSGQEEAYCVCDKDPASSTLYVCRTSSKHKYLMTNGSFVVDLHWIGGPPLENQEVKLKFKHTEKFAKGKIVSLDLEGVWLEHEEIVKTTPGQAVVFYSFDERVCLGSGFLRSSVNNG
nr:tRNA 2-thiouridine(34) synthase MnmA [Candidatus Mycoplasma haematolamae]